MPGLRASVEHAFKVIKLQIRFTNISYRWIREENRATENAVHARELVDDSPKADGDDGMSPSSAP
jgi:hypothetical protein